MSAGVWKRIQTVTADHGFLAGGSLRTKLPIAAGSCSPAPPTKVYERSKPAGPSTFISQLSFARDPTIDTRHSPTPVTQHVFNDSYNLPASSGIARILHLDPDRHVSILYEAAK
jgi:hypothetical protein